MALLELILVAMVDLQSANLQYVMAYEATIGVVIPRKFVFIRYIAEHKKATLECMHVALVRGWSLRYHASDTLVTTSPHFPVHLALNHVTKMLARHAWRITQHQCITKWHVKPEPRKGGTNRLTLIPSGGNKPSGMR